MKKTFYTEAAYVLGILALSLGVAFTSRADFGMSMIVAPSYILHLKISPVLPFFSLGAAEFCVQALLLAVLCLIRRRFSPAILFSFVTVMIYSVVVDGCIALVALLPGETFVARGLFFTIGLLITALGVALFFASYIPPGGYEMFVKGLAEHFSLPVAKVKTIYDCSSCLVAVILSFLFFGFMQFEGVKLGTVICALLNGRLIGFFGSLLNRHFDMRDGLPASVKNFFQR